MRLPILSSVVAVAMFSNLGIGVAAEGQAAQPAGASVQGVQLSIALSNNILVIGEEATVVAAITNSSTNSITLAEGFDVSLLGDSGRRYQLVMPVLLHSRRVVENLKPGERRSWSIPVKVRGDVKPGNYTLETTKSFSVKLSGRYQGYKLVANLLTVQVK